MITANTKPREFASITTFPLPKENPGKGTARPPKQNKRSMLEVSTAPLLGIFLPIPILIPVVITNNLLPMHQFVYRERHGNR